MPAVNLIDEIFVVAEPESVRRVVCDARWWAQWLPGIALSPYEDRGALGVRWTVTGELSGTAEVWLEVHGDGTIVHAYLRADPASGGDDAGRRLTRAATARYALPLKRALFQVKDRLEGQREPGTSRVPLAERVVSATDSEPADKGSKGAASDGGPDHLTHPDLR